MPYFNKLDAGKQMKDAPFLSGGRKGADCFTDQSGKLVSMATGAMESMSA